MSAETWVAALWVLIAATAVLAITIAALIYRASRGDDARTGRKPRGRE